MDPLISIIVPIYNRERTLDLCINSVLKQSFLDWELLLIDDGSSDSSFEICKSYANKDSRIRVIHQNNGGVSKARNIGLDNVKGRYVTFLDSDDAYHSEHLMMLSNIYSEKADLIFTNLGHVSINNYYHNLEKGEECKITLLSQNEIFKYLFSINNPINIGLYSCANKIFSVKILKENNIRFRDDISLGEDQIFVLTYLHFVYKLIHFNNLTYYQIIWPEKTLGLGSKKRSYEEYLKNFKANYFSLLDLFRFCQLDYIRIYATDYIINRIVSRIIYSTMLEEKFRFFSNKNFYSFLKEKIVPIIQSEKLNLKNVKKNDDRIFSRLLLFNIKLTLFISFVYIQIYMKTKLLKQIIAKRL